MSEHPALAFDRVSMEFPGVKALTDVSFYVRAGSVHALMGENGAGKSTLLKILSGAYRPTSGAVVIDGQPRQFASTVGALAAGVAVIYQELHLVPEMTVAENLFLGHLPNRLGFVDRRALAAAARRQLELIGEAIDPDTKLGRLSLAQRQMVEIAKALTRGARIIAFDEPTSSLSDREVRRLFTIIRDLKARGCTILYVSHRMEEIFALCDRLTVLRDGRHVETAALATLTRDGVVQRMVGRELADIYNYAPRPRGEGGLAVDGLFGPGLAEPCSFTVHAGEIVGFFGLVGAGRTELLRLLFGATPRRAGRVTLFDRDLHPASPREAIEAGIVLCPEDRKKEGIVPVRSVLENINLSARRRRSHGGVLIDETWENANARQRIDQLRVRTPSAQQLIRNLSGGNQQKVILGRWLSETVRVILLDEPTRGIDIGAKSEIYAIIQQLARDGVCVLLVSSELPEVLGVSDRIAVMRQGRIAAMVDRADATEERLLKLALPLETASAS
ncbi:L-arabinose ABC transporter ATP-binding protein AraG [Horticoccus sp. 23ND18S-11]|uniref:L-arabinose ABC transporter ATP-binding protein AraG n=1 Tax=Horticoccus sp. 23ND18S-11 TaxID=3391832 RepID=UPI0039C981A5